MKKLITVIALLLTLASFSAVHADENASFSLTLQVDKLRNSKGVVIFNLYNRDGTIPDKKFEKFYKQQTSNISDGAAHTVFQDLPKGRYAVMILHDENKNNMPDKGFVLPTEGVGVTNYSSIGVRRRPNFKKASFELDSDTEKNIKVTYF